LTINVNGVIFVYIDSRHSYIKTLIFNLMNNQKNFLSRLFKKDKEITADTHVNDNEKYAAAQDDTSFEDSLGEEMRPFNTPKTYELPQTKSAHRIV
jgi:hypothetical protein